MDQEQINQKLSLNECPTPNGTLMVIGGAEKKGNNGENERSKPDEGIEILKTFMKLIPEEAPIVELITTAGSKNVEDTYETYKKVFLSLGASGVNHIHHDAREELNDEELELRLNTAHAVFFAGGDQLKLTSIYGGTPFLFLLKNRYIYENVVVAGTSAGAMALSTPMIYDGTGKEEMIAGQVKITTGFEFIHDVCVDTHFVDRGRFVRMAQVIATNPACIGIGIEEDTAIIVKGLHATVVGSGVVITIDGKNSRKNNITDYSENTVITIQNLSVSILGAGEEFEIPQLNPPHK
jgi:cyanophycinase